MNEEKEINRIAAEIESGEKIQAEELPRLADGSIDLETLSGGRRDEKGRLIIPDETIKKHYRELPNDLVSESGELFTFNGGYLKKANREVQRMGAEALNAKNAQRRSFKEAIDIMLKSKASAANISELGLEEGATNLDVVIAAALKQSARGNVKAMDFIRDTVGEKPAEQLNADISGLSEDDKAMIENIKKRLEADKSD